MDNPNRWSPFYSPAASDSTVISTGSNSTQIQAQAQAGQNIEGRVGKPTRRRTRASRRAPTTLLNTDPTNFRAMVQQFTGAPVGPYQTASQAGPVISFGQHHGPAVGLGQQPYHDGATSFPGGNGNGNGDHLSDVGLVQGYNPSGGFYLDGMFEGGNGNRNGGYFL